MNDYTLDEAKFILGMLAGRETGFTTQTQVRDAARTVLDHLAEQWEYGTALRTKKGDLWDFEFEGTREDAEWHVGACAKDHHDHDPDECVIVRRKPRVSAGEWELVDREGEPS